MNFNKNYPIVILSDLRIDNIDNDADDYYNVEKDHQHEAKISFLKFFNIVIPYSVIDDASNNKQIEVKKFLNNIFEIMSKKNNLCKNGYKLENGCMLYLDVDKNKLKHREIDDLDSQRKDIKYIAYAKNLKEKYKDMKVVLLTNDNIIKSTASLFDVETKTLDELKQSIEEKDLLQFIKNNNNAEIINSIYNNVRKNFAGNYYSLYCNYHSYFYDYEVFYIVKFQIKRNGLDKLLKLINIEYFYMMVFDILSKNRDIYGLEKLYKILNDYFKRYRELNDLIENNMRKIKSLKDKDDEFTVNELNEPNILKVKECIRQKKEIDCQIEELKKLYNEQINESGLEDIKKIEFRCMKNYLYNILNRINELKK